MTNKKITLFFLLPVVLSFILHFRVLNLDLIGYHVWRQSQTQTVIYNFSFSDNSIFHPQKFDLTTGDSMLLYEFPLYQWIIAQVNNGIGYSVLHTRLMSFLIFIFLLLGFYRMLVKFVKAEVALISNTLLCFSPLLYYYCVNPLPDLLALCFAVWSMDFFLVFLLSGKREGFLLFLFFLSLAALVKLPYLMFGAVFILYAFRSLKEKNYRAVLLGSGLLLLALLPVAAWYTIAIPTWRDKGVVTGMADNHKSWLRLLDCLQFNIISSVPELITNYASCLFLVTGIWLFFKRRKQLKKFYGYFIFLFLIVSAYFLYELNMIEKAHDYYLMPFVPLIFLVVAYGVNHLFQSGYRKLVLILACIVPLTAWLRIDSRWSLKTPGFESDYLSEQKLLQSLVPLGEKCIIDHDDSHFIALYYLKRQGYSLFEKEIGPALLERRYNDGARFLVTENPSFDPAQYREFNFELLYEHHLRLYKLHLK